MIEIDRVQAGSAHVVADGVDLRRAAVADDGDALLRILGGDGAGELQIGGRRRRVRRVLHPGIDRRDAEQVSADDGGQIDVRSARALARRGADRLQRLDGAAAEQEHDDARQFDGDQGREHQRCQPGTVAGYAG